MEVVVERVVYLQEIPRLVHLLHAFWGPVHLTFAVRQDSQAVIGRRINLLYLELARRTSLLSLLVPWSLF